MPSASCSETNLHPFDDRPNGIRSIGAKRVDRDDRAGLGEPTTTTEFESVKEPTQLWIGVRATAKRTCRLLPNVSWMGLRAVTTPHATARG